MTTYILVIPSPARVWFSINTIKGIKSYDNLITFFCDDCKNTDIVYNCERPTCFKCLSNTYLLNMERILSEGFMFKGRVFYRDYSFVYRDKHTGKLTERVGRLHNYSPRRHPKKYPPIFLTNKTEFSI